MSRHHMLPPIIYTPPPKPKTITRKRRPAMGPLDELDEADEAGETEAASHAAAAGIKLPSAQMPEIEGADRKPQGPAGRFSEDMLTALLRAQELKN